MLISNGEPFIRLEVAARAFYYDELFLKEPDVIHFENLSSWLDLYAYVSGICNMNSPTNPQSTDRIDKLPKKIKGMCNIDESFPSYDAQFNCNAKTIINLKISPFVEGMNNELIGCFIRPIDNYINHDNYFSLSYVHLSEFINLAKEVGVDLNAIFLEEIISDDSTFKELKRLSEKLPSKKFNVKQAANKYLKYFDGILEDTIIQACELASANYERMMKKIYAEANKGKGTDSTQYNLAENKVVKLLTEKSATIENVELLKNQLSDDWKEALFDSRISSQSIKEKDNTLKLIGLLSLFIADKKGISFGSKDKPNVSQIYRSLSLLIEQLEDDSGLKERAVRDKITKGLDLVTLLT